jgi:IS1 family transposase
LLERLSLRGVCRVLDLSLSWLVRFITELYGQVPRDLNFQMPDEAEFEILCLEADELWSFVGHKKNKRWIWLIIERTTYQVVAVHIGDRSERSALALWRKVPLEVQKQAFVLTDKWDAYAAAIPANQHLACAKKSGQTSLIEGFNCTLRQRVSRLVRKTLSFSKPDEALLRLDEEEEAALSAAQDMSLTKPNAARFTSVKKHIRAANMSAKKRFREHATRRIKPNAARKP